MSKHVDAMTYIRRVLLDNGFSDAEVSVKELELVFGSFRKAYLSAGWRDKAIGMDMADFLHHDPKTAARHYLPTNPKQLKTAAILHGKFSGCASAEAAEAGDAAEVAEAGTSGNSKPAPPAAVS